MLSLSKLAIILGCTIFIVTYSTVTQWSYNRFTSLYNHYRPSWYSWKPSKKNHGSNFWWDRRFSFQNNQVMWFCQKCYKNNWNILSSPFYKSFDYHKSYFHVALQKRKKVIYCNIHKHNQCSTKFSQRKKMPKEKSRAFS